MSRGKGILLAALITATISAILPAKAELIIFNAGPYRYLEGSILKLGVEVTFAGYVASGASAVSLSGDPEAEPYVDQMYGSVEIRKGTAVRTVDGPFTITVDPALATAKISGNTGGISIDVTLAATGTPEPHFGIPGPGGIQPPGFLAAGAGASTTRTATASGSASGTGVGSITAGVGSGEVGSGVSGFLLYAES